MKKDRQHREMNGAKTKIRTLARKTPFGGHSKRVSGYQKGNIGGDPKGGIPHKT